MQVKRIGKTIKVSVSVIYKRLVFCVRFYRLLLLVFECLNIFIKYSIAVTLPEKYSNAEFFLVRIFPALGLNTERYGVNTE